MSSTPPLTRTGLLRNRTWPLAIVLALAVVLGVFTPTQARAVSTNIDVPDPSEIAAIVEFPGFKPQQPVFGRLFFRDDTRPPAEIWADGFRARGTNTNIADHLLNPATAPGSGYVSTTWDPRESGSFGKNNFSAEGFYEYTGMYDKPGVDVAASVKNALIESTSEGFAYTDSGRALAEKFETAKQSWFGDLQAEHEIAVPGAIESKQVMQARKWTYGENGWQAGPWERNPGFKPTPLATPHTTAEVPENGVCYGGARASCSIDIGDEGDLADLNGGRFSGSTDDFDFTLDVERLAEDDKLLLAPAPSTIALADEFAASGQSLDDFERFSEELGDALAVDAEALAEVSSHADVITAVGESIGIALDTGSELVPYFGIAATGYAMREDLDNGKWGDFAADAIAEGIQSAMLAAPEFDFVWAPLLWADQLLKTIGDTFWSWAHPKPKIDDAHREHLERANDQVDAMPTVLDNAWTKERVSLLKTFYAEHAEEQHADQLANKVQADIAVLKSMHRAVLAELYRYEATARAKATNAGAIRRAQASRLNAEVQLVAATNSAIANRVAQYEERFDDFVDVTVDAAWSLDLEPAVQKFVDEIANDYIDAGTVVGWEAYFEKRWNDVESGHKTWAEPLVTQSREALGQLLVSTERERLWSASASQQMDEAFRDDMRKRFATAVTERIAADARPWTPSGVRTVQGDDTALDEGDDLVTVESRAVTARAVKSFAGKAVVTVPEGAATFAERQDVRLEFRKPGDTTWSESKTATVELTPSDDGLSLTTTFSTSGSFSLPAGSELRWMTAAVPAAATSFSAQTELTIDSGTTLASTDVVAAPEPFVDVPLGEQVVEPGKAAAPASQWSPSSER